MSSGDRRMMRTLDALFRDGLIDDCIANGVTEVDVWKLVPQRGVNRTQTNALIRKFVMETNRFYPRSMRCDANRLKISPDFLRFMATHRKMGSPDADSRKAWAAMRSIMDE